MNGRFPLSGSSKEFLSIFAIFLAVGVFFLPWHVPLSQPSYSQSYTYGFNNFAAALWIAGCLGVMVVWQFFFPSPMGILDSIRVALSAMMPDSGSPCHDRPLFKNFIAMSLLALIINIGWFWLTPRAYGTEAAYYLSRIDMMVMGLHPYRDFQCSYGSLFLFAPFYLYRLSMGVLSIEQAYWVILLLNWVGGLFFLYYILGQLTGRFEKVTVFWVIALSCLSPSFGLHSLPLRYTVPLASILAFHRVVLNSVGRSRELVKVASAAFLAPFLAFAVSPEMGIATWLAIMVYLALVWTTPFRRLSWTALATALVLPAVAWCFSKEYFNAVLSFSGGGNNFPIYPIPAILLFLVAIFCVTPALTLHAIKHRNLNGAISLALCVVTGLLIVAALGRADDGHVCMNGLGIFLLFLAALSKGRSRLFKPAIVIYALLFIAGGVYNFGYINGHISHALQLRKMLADPEQVKGCLYVGGEARQSGLYYSKMLPVPEGYRELLKFPRLGIPMGCDEGLERFLKLNGKLQFEYHMMPYAEMYLKKHLQRKLADLAKMDFILVPTNTLQAQPTADPVRLAQADSEELSNVMHFPVRFTFPRNPPFDPNLAVAKEIKEQYSVVASIGQGYFIMRRNSGL